MPFCGLLISCAECGRPVESVVYSQHAADGRFGGYWPFADTHERAYGHYPYDSRVTRTRGLMPWKGDK